MQVTETARDGLKRTLQVVIGQSELNERFSERLDELKDRYGMNLDQVFRQLVGADA